MATLGTFELLKQEYKIASQTGDLRSIARHSPAAAKWYMEFIQQNIVKMNALEGLRSGKSTSRPSPGEFVIYSYDPKLKETLPFYDTMPLVLITSITNKGWYGINFHYMPPQIRLKIIQEMYKISRSTSNDQMKFKMSWQKAVAIGHQIGQSKWFKHAIKQYLFNHVKSNVIRVKGDNVEPMLFLPIARFKKSTQQDVWGAA